MVQYNNNTWITQAKQQKNLNKKSSNKLMT